MIGDRDVEEEQEDAEGGAESDAGVADEEQAASDQDEQIQKQAAGRKNLDLQLEEASRYTFVQKLEQLLEDIKNLFT